MAGEHVTERVPNRRQLGIVERASRVLRRVACREQQLVAVSQRNLELLCEVQHHLRAWLRASRLDEAQMPRRDARLECQVKLAQPPALAPIA